MKNARGVLPCVIVAMMLGCASLRADQLQDEADIRTIQAGQAEAWNRHDATAYAALFTETADVVNVVGWWWKGRAELTQKLTAAFAVMFRESTLTITGVTVRFLTPEIAVAHVMWSMVGAKAPPGIPEPRQGIQTQVLQRSGGRWLIAAFQNTNGIPEAPFPTAPLLGSAREGGQPMDAAHLTAFAKRYTDAWCSQKPASVAAFFAANGSLTINDGSPHVGRAAITEAALGFMRDFPDLVVEMDGVSIESDHFVYRWTLIGKNTGPGGTGKSVRISGYEEWTFGPDGLIAASKGHFDAADYNRQLGKGTEGK